MSVRLFAEIDCPSCGVQVRERLRSLGDESVICQCGAELLYRVEVTFGRDLRCAVILAEKRR